MNARLVPTTRKPQTCWAVLSADKTDPVVHATGVNRSNALEWFKRAYGYDATLEFDDKGKARFIVRRIRWQVVEPAKKPAKFDPSKAKVGSIKPIPPLRERLVAALGEKNVNKLAKQLAKKPAKKGAKK